MFAFPRDIISKITVSRNKFSASAGGYVFILQEKKFRFQNKMEQLKDRSKRVMENVEEKRMDMIRKWEEKSRDFIDTFLLLFGRDGRLVSRKKIVKNYTIFQTGRVPFFP